MDESQKKKKKTERSETFLVFKIIGTFGKFSLRHVTGTIGLGVQCGPRQADLSEV
jgi:hypothetical protein